MAKVIRKKYGGETKAIKARELVPGDIVEIASEIIANNIIRIIINVIYSHLK